MRLLLSLLVSDSSGHYGALMMRDALRRGLEWTQQSSRLMRAFAPDDFLCDWQELDNKIESFRLFQYADRELQLPPGRAPVQQVLSRTPEGETFHRIWVLEGIGHMAGLASSLSGRGLLTEGEAGKLPETEMVPMHAGMGTAFAEKVFKGLSPNPSKADVDRAVKRFVDVCAANCRPGWEDGCMEPLGLVVRCLYPSLLRPVSVAMAAMRPSRRSLFWHGVGRGLYFVPANFLPYSGARKGMIQGAMAESSDFDDRRNVLAGLIWAVTLVNLCHPRILRSLAGICSELKLYDEFTNGMISALLAWRHMAPEDTGYIGAYTRMQTDRATDGLLWSYWVVTPARDALANVYAGLERRNNIAALYTYRTEDELRCFSAV